MGLGHILAAFGKAAVSGIPGTAEREQNDAADLKNRQADLEFANHLQDLGAKPIIHGLVREDVAAPDGSTTAVYRAPDPTRIKTTQKTAQGPVQWEVPSIEEQATRKADRGLKLLHQQFQGESDVRATQAEEAARNKGLDATATGQAQQDLANKNREQNGVVAPQALQDRFANIFTTPGGPPTKEPVTSGISIERDQPAKPRKFLPAELDPLMAGLANSENIAATVDQKQQTKAMQQLSGVTDQEGYDAVRAANPEAAARWPKIFSAPIVKSLIRQNVPVEKQPEYDAANVKLAAMNLDPATLDAHVDKIVPPTGDTAALNARTKEYARSRLAHGDVDGADKILKDAYDELGRSETAVRTAKASAPIKINIAGQEQTAKANAALASSGLTDDDINREGRQLALTGESAQLGNGSAAVKARILHAKNQFARDSGLSPSDMAVAKAAYKGDAKSLAAMVTQRDQIGSFEQTAGKNLDLFLDAASKIPDTGIPWLNTPIRDLDAKVVGSANMAAVNAAREVANNEIAKVTSGGGLGGVLSDAARKEVQGYNPQNATFAQTKAVAAILRKDMGNRMASFNSTIGDIEHRIANPGGAQPAAATPAAAAPSAGARKVGDTVTLKDGTTARITEILPNGKYKVE